jgi:hypothetical protein
MVQVFVLIVYRLKNKIYLKKTCMIAISVKHDFYHKLDPNDSFRVDYLDFQPGPRTTLPGLALVCSPFSITCVPLTNTCTMPVLY